MQIAECDCRTGSPNRRLCTLPSAPHVDGTTRVPSVRRSGRCPITLDYSTDLHLVDDIPAGRLTGPFYVTARTSVPGRSSRCCQIPRAWSAGRLHPVAQHGATRRRMPRISPLGLHPFQRRTRLDGKHRHWSTGRYRTQTIDCSSDASAPRGSLFPPPAKPLASTTGTPQRRRRQAPQSLPNTPDSRSHCAVRTE